jgi:hypothetical protein
MLQASESLDESRAVEIIVSFALARRRDLSEGIEALNRREMGTKSDDCIGPDEHSLRVFLAISPGYVCECG